MSGMSSYRQTGKPDLEDLMRAIEGTTSRLIDRHCPIVPTHHKEANDR